MGAAVIPSALAAAVNEEQNQLSKSHPLDGIDREKIKITDVEVSLMSYDLPKDKQWVSAEFLVPKVDSCLVRIYTDQGIVGTAEASPYGGMREMKHFIEDLVKPTLMGKNPFDVDLLAAGSLHFMQSCAYAGLNCAMWDIIGKSKNKPLYELLSTDGKPETHIRLYASSGVEYAWYDRPEDLVDQAVQHKEDGYTAMKYRIGTDWKANDITVEKFIPLLQKLRAAVGDSFELMHENNMRMNLEQCLELAPILEELNIFWFEEPVDNDTPDAIENHLKIKEALPTVKIAGGESKINRFDFQEWMDRGAYDIVQPDMNTVGITDGWYIAKMAALRGKICCPHNWHGGLSTYAEAHMVAAISNRYVLELNMTYNPFKTELFHEPLVVENGYINLPKRPGLGIDLIPGIEKKFPYNDGPWGIRNPYLPKK